MLWIKGIYSGIKAFLLLLKQRYFGIRNNKSTTNKAYTGRGKVIILRISDEILSKLEKYGNVVDSQFEINHIHYINFKYFAIFSVNCVNGFDISKGCSLILKNI